MINPILQTCVNSAKENSKLKNVKPKGIAKCPGLFSVLLIKRKPSLDT